MYCMLCIVIQYYLTKQNYFWVKIQCECRGIQFHSKELEWKWNWKFKNQWKWNGIGIEIWKLSGIGIKVNGIGMESELKIQNFSITIENNEYEDKQLMLHQFKSLIYFIIGALIASPIICLLEISYFRLKARIYYLIYFFYIHILLYLNLIENFDNWSYIKWLSESKWDSHRFKFQNITSKLMNSNFNVINDRMFSSIRYTFNTNVVLILNINP